MTNRTYRRRRRRTTLRDESDESPNRGSQPSDEREFSIPLTLPLRQCREESPAVSRRDHEGVDALSIPLILPLRQCRTGTLPASPRHHQCENALSIPLKLPLRQLRSDLSRGDVGSRNCDDSLSIPLTLPLRQCRADALPVVSHHHEDGLPLTIPLVLPLRPRRSDSSTREVAPLDRNCELTSPRKVSAQPVLQTRSAPHSLETECVPASQDISTIPPSPENQVIPETCVLSTPESARHESQASAYPLPLSGVCLSPSTPESSLRGSPNYVSPTPRPMTADVSSLGIRGSSDYVSPTPRPMPADVISSGQTPRSTIFIPETCPSSPESSKPINRQGPASISEGPTQKESDTRILSCVMVPKICPSSSPDSSKPCSVIRRIQSTNHVGLALEDEATHEQSSILIPETCPSASPESSQQEVPDPYASSLNHMNSVDSLTQQELITPLPSRLAAFRRVAEWKSSPDPEILVPDTPDQSDQEPNRNLSSTSCEAPTSQLGAISESTMYNKSFSSASAPSAHTPSSNRTLSRYSGADSESFGAQCLVDGEEVNRIRRDFGMSPASSLGPNQSLALDPQVAKYARKVLRRSAALDVPMLSANEGNASSLWAGSPTESRSDIHRDDVSPSEICPVTPHKAAPRSRLRQNVSSNSSNDSDSSSVIRERQRPSASGQSGNSDDIFNGFSHKHASGEASIHATPRNRSTKKPTGVESEVDTGRSSIHKRATTRSAKRARQHLRFDVTPMPLELADDNVDDDSIKFVQEIVRDSMDCQIQTVSKDAGCATLNKNREKSLMLPPENSMHRDRVPGSYLNLQKNLRTATTMKSMFTTAAGSKISPSKNKLADLKANSMFRTAKDTPLMVSKDKLADVKMTSMFRTAKDTPVFVSKAMLDEVRIDHITPCRRKFSSNVNLTECAGKLTTNPNINVDMPNDDLNPKSVPLLASSKPLAEYRECEESLVGNIHSIPLQSDQLVLAHRSTKRPRESLESLVVRRLPGLHTPVMDKSGVHRSIFGEMVTPMRTNLLAHDSNGKSGLLSTNFAALQTSVAKTRPLKADANERKDLFSRLRQPVFSSEKRNVVQKSAIYRTGVEDIQCAERWKAGSTSTAMETSKLDEAVSTARKHMTTFVMANEDIVTPVPPLPMFTTANGKSLPELNLDKTESKFRQPLFSTGSGRPVALSKLNKAVANLADYPPLFATGSGRPVRTLKTPSELQPFFDALHKQPIHDLKNQPLARVLPFNTSKSKTDAKEHSNMKFTKSRVKSLYKSTDLLAKLPSRRQLFQTPPSKPNNLLLDPKTRQRPSGLRNTPFKRPRRVPPVTPRRETNAKGEVLRETYGLDDFFPKGSVPHLYKSGRLKPESEICTGNVTSSMIGKVGLISSPERGTSFVFCRDRFGDWNVLPKKVQMFCKFEEISSFSVTDCVSLLTHVFPSAEKRAVTRIGSKSWTKMSFGLSAWKLSKLEVDAIEDGYSASFLTAANLIRDLWRRVDREWHSNQAPHLAQMLRRDASPRSHVVLVLSNINVEPEIMLEVSDGWYICRMKPCNVLAGRIRAGLLSVGDKIHVFDSLLVSGSSEPFFFGDGDEMGSNVLAPSANCVKRVVFEEARKCKLGIRKSPLFIRSLAGLKQDGGRCPGAQVVILRSYPVFFIESFTSKGSERQSTFRRREAEETEQAKFHTQREALLGADVSENEGAAANVRNVRAAMDIMVCGIEDDVSDPRSEKTIRVYKPDEELVRLLSVEGSIVQLPVLKPSGRNWVILSASGVRPLAAPTSKPIPVKPRSLKTCEELFGTVPDGADFDGIYIALHMTASVDKIRHVYMIDNTEESKILVLELRGVDAECTPRTFARLDKKHHYPLVVLRDTTKDGVNEDLGLVHSFASLRAEILSAASLLRRRDRSWSYLKDRLSAMEVLVDENQQQLELLREAIICFVLGERSSISAYFSSTQQAAM